MIQRIQSLYLLLAAVCVGIMLFMPLAQFYDGATDCTMKAFMLSGGDNFAVRPMLYLGILLSLATLLPLITIFLFKNRMLQVRLCIVEIVLLVGALVMCGIYCYLCYKTVGDVENGAATVTVWNGLPLLSLIFTVLATRAIFRDELLIRSLDRIR